MLGERPRGAARIGPAIPWPPRIPGQLGPAIPRSPRGPLVAPSWLTGPARAELGPLREPKTSVARGWPEGGAVFIGGGVRMGQPPPKIYIKFQRL